MRQILAKQINDPIISELLDNIKKPNISYGPWIAGGVARMLWFEKPWYEHDIDFFFPTEKMFAKAKKKLEKFVLTDQERKSIKRERKQGNKTFSIRNVAQSSTELTHITPNACTYSFKLGGKDIKAQIINRQFYDSVDAIWSDFDFRVCNFATDGKILIADVNAVKDCENKTLICNDPLTRKIDVKRTIKYSIYGFNPEEKIIKDLFRQHSDGTLMEGWMDEYPS